MQSVAEFEALIDFDLELGESPVWDDVRNALWFVDIVSPAVFCLDHASRNVTTYPMPTDVGSIGLTSDSRLLVALRTGVHLFDPDSGALDFLVHPEPDRTMNRLTMERSGRMAASGLAACTMPIPRAPSGALYRVTPAGESVRILDGNQGFQRLGLEPGRADDVLCRYTRPFHKGLRLCCCHRRSRMSAC